MNTAFSQTTVQSLAQFAGNKDWQLHLAQSRPHHTLVWITRGQGRLLLDGMRRGVGAHNVVWIPEGHLFSIELGSQGAALVMTMPPGMPLRLPEMARLLRIRDGHLQRELTGLLESAGREQQEERPLQHDALEAYGGLISVWLRRQIMRDEHVPEPRNAAGRLSARFCASVAASFSDGFSMADYAMALGVSPTHLTRAVKSATGRTAADLLTERIVFEARVLLRDTAEPARAIAAHLGFGSAPYFTRFIRKHTGLPPSKLRG